MKKKRKIKCKNKKIRKIGKDKRECVNKWERINKRNQRFLLFMHFLFLIFILTILIEEKK